MTVIRQFCLVKVTCTRGHSMWAGSLFTSFTFCKITGSCSLIRKENIRCSITWVSLIEILAMINLYYVFMNTLMYVDYVFMRKYAQICLQGSNPVWMFSARQPVTSSFAIEICKAWIESERRYILLTPDQILLELGVCSFFSMPTKLYYVFYNNLTQIYRKSSNNFVLLLFGSYCAVLPRRFERHK